MAGNHRNSSSSNNKTYEAKLENYAIGLERRLNMTYVKEIQRLNTIINLREKVIQYQTENLRVIQQEYTKLSKINQEWKAWEKQQNPDIAYQEILENLENNILQISLTNTPVLISTLRNLQKTISTRRINKKNK